MSYYCFYINSQILIDCMGVVSLRKHPDIRSVTILMFFHDIGMTSFPTLHYCSEILSLYRYTEFHDEPIPIQSVDINLFFMPQLPIIGAGYKYCQYKYLII